MTASQTAPAPTLTCPYCGGELAVWLGAEGAGIRTAEFRPTVECAHTPCGAQWDRWGKCKKKSGLL